MSADAEGTFQSELCAISAGPQEGGERTAPARLLVCTGLEATRRPFPLIEAPILLKKNSLELHLVLFLG